MRQPDDPGVREDEAWDLVAEKTLGIASYIWSVLFIVCLVMLTLTVPAKSHDFYPWECCSDNDCQEISDETVRIGQGGYLVTVKPGEHIMWPASKPEPLQLFIPYTKVKLSPDGKYHLCINGQGAMLCFYASVGSF